MQLNEDSALNKAFWVPYPVRFKIDFFFIKPKVMMMKALEILIAAAAAFSLGFIWYGLFFKSHWNKRTDSKKSGGETGVFGYMLIFLSLCAISYFMNNGCLETHINGGDLGHGIFHGGLYGLSYAVPIIAIHHVYQKKSIKVFLIDGGYAMICFGAIGGMLALLTLMVYSF